MTMPAADEPVGPLLSAARTELEASHRLQSERAAQYLELLAQEPGGLHREGGPRHLTASAVVIDAPGEHVALLWHRKGRFWVQPGGHIEADDPSLEQAARREVAEELGLEELERVGDGPAVLHQHPLDAAFGRCREHWDVQYLLRTSAPASQVPLGASEETPKARWIPWPRFADGSRSAEQLPPGTVPDMPAKLAEIAQLLEELEGARG